MNETILKILAGLILATTVLNAGEKRYASAPLKIRQNPNQTAKQIGLTPQGSTLELLEETGDEITISGATGKWSRVKYKGKIGYAFGGFLVTDQPVDLIAFNDTFGQVIRKNEQLTCRPNVVYIIKNVIILHDPCGNDADGMSCLVKSKVGNEFICDTDYLITDELVEKYSLGKNNIG